MISIYIDVIVSKRHVPGYVGVDINGLHLNCVLVMSMQYSSIHKIGSIQYVKKSNPIFKSFSLPLGECEII
jgi:hypothetical protein